MPRPPRRQPRPPRAHARRRAGRPGRRRGGGHPCARPAARPARGRDRDGRASDAVCTVGTVAAGASSSASPSPGAPSPTASAGALPSTPVPSEAAPTTPIRRRGPVRDAAPTVLPLLGRVARRPGHGPRRSAPAAPGGSVSPSPSGSAAVEHVTHPGRRDGRDPGPATPGTATPGVAGRPRPQPTPSTVPSLVPLPSATAAAVDRQRRRGRLRPDRLRHHRPHRPPDASGCSGRTRPPPPSTVRAAAPRSSPAAAPVLLQAEGTIATTAVGAVLSRSTDGPEAGLEAARASCRRPRPGCPASPPAPPTAPSSSSATPTTPRRPSTSPSTAATVGSRSPAARAATSPAHGSRSISLSGLVDAEGPLTVAVQATSGRVAAAARRIRTSGDSPAGADWVVPAAAPATRSWSRPCPATTAPASSSSPTPVSCGPP